MNANEHALIPRRSFFRGVTALGLCGLSESPGGAGETNETPDAKWRKNWPAADDAGYWFWLRQQFSIPSDEAYFNTGTLGACPRPVLWTL